LKIFNSVLGIFIGLILFQAAISEDTSRDVNQSENSVVNSRMMMIIDDDDDDDDGDDEEDSSNDDTLEEVQEKLQGLEGTKCRVAYTQDWGTLECHNALVLSAEPIDLETGELKVMLFFMLSGTGSSLASVPCIRLGREILLSLFEKNVW
jgi:hypothetical protein